MDTKQSNSNYSNIQKDKTYTLQNLLNKINRTEPVTFGNYYVNFNEIFPKNFDCKDYMKNHVSLFNDDFAEKKKLILNENFYHLQPNNFKVFENETLIYIFYFMTRDILQLYSAEELYEKNWKYHINSQLWFTEIGRENEENEENEEKELIYFNPIEWKKCKYIFGNIDPKEFLSKDEVKKYVKQLSLDNNNNNNNNFNNNTNKNNNNNNINNNNNNNVNNNNNNNNNNSNNNNNINSNKNNINNNNPINNNNNNNNNNNKINNDNSTNNNAQNNK